MLSGNRVVITGAAGTLGQAAAGTAREYGAQVIGLDSVADFECTDLDSYHQVALTDRAATRECISSLGPFDALMNIAGGFAMGTDAAEPDDTQWDWMFKINVDTARNTIMAAAPVLKGNGGGRLVNLGALGALSGQAGMSAYCCAKGSVMKLTESLSEELKAEGINVNAVLPSLIDTAPNREGMPDADYSDWASPEQLAAVLCFLASTRASAVHGALLPVKSLV